MKVNKKTCKGNYKTKEWACGDTTYIYRFGLCKDCYRVWLFSSEDGKKEIEKARIKGKIKLTKEKKQAHKELKDSIKDWGSELQKVVNHIVRIIDKGLPCLANERMAKQFHAGHIISIGANKTIKFNLHNIHRQSAQSNHFQNEDGLLREGLKNEYGIDYFDFVMGLNATPVIKLSNDVLHEKQKVALKIRRALLKANKTYNLAERIELRNTINLELGIYDKEFCTFNY